MAMQPTLQDSLSDILGETVTVPQQTGASATVQGLPSPLPVQPRAVTGQAGSDIARLVDQANDEYAKAQEALRNGDWTEYGRRMTALDKSLRELRSKVRGK